MKLLVAGDFGCGERILKRSITSQKETVFNSIADIVKNCDYSIVNLEAPLKGDGKPINKRGPHIFSNLQSIEMLKECGFNCFTLANNHIRDWGDKGIQQTIEEIRKLKIDYVGAGHNLDEAKRILYVRIESNTIAVINVCESEFNIADKNQGGAAPLDDKDVYYKIKEAQNNADTILVIVHGGHEMYPLPSPRMKRTYRFFIDVGADAVINHHQHCYSGYEIYNGKPIFYGLGNFCFDKLERKNDLWYEGYMAELCIEGKAISFNLHPYIQCKDEPIVKLMSSEEIQEFQENISKLNGIIDDDALLESTYENYLANKYKSSIIDFSPFNSKILRGLAKRGYISDFISLQKALLFFDRISCESHRDVTLGIFKKKINKCN